MGSDLPVVTRIETVHAITIPGTSSRSVTSLNAEKIQREDLKMYLTPDGVLVEAAAKRAVVPFSNIKVLILG